MISSEAMAIIWIGEVNTAHSFIGAKRILTMRGKKEAFENYVTKNVAIYIFFFSFE
jgi:hypothetical protein